MAWDEILPGKSNPQLLFLRHEQRDDDTQRLGECRAECGSGSTHMENSHKYIVERDICRAGNRDKIHRTFRVAHTTEDGSDDIISCNKRNSDKADRQVPDRTRDCFGWCLNQ